MNALLASGHEETLALIEAAGRSEPAAVRALAERLLPVVRARVRRLVARRAELAHLDPNDVVQHVFVRLLENGASQLRKWSPERGATLEGYVGMVSEREAGNVGQKAASRERFETNVDTEGASAAPSPEAQVVERDSASRLTAFLTAELPPKGQLVLKCLYADGLDTDETARMLGVNRQVVYNWQHRIRVLARQFLPATAG